jgi:H+-transporting ATPase
METPQTANPPVPNGLTSAEAAQRLQQYGPNEVTETKPNSVLVFLQKLWAPVPWMLEITIILELYLGKNIEAVVIGALLIFNAILSYVQEGRAQNALALLRQKMTVEMRTRRDGQWRIVPARELVPGDVVHIRMGDILPADMVLTEGIIEMDQSALTGESMPVEVAVGQTAFAGAVVERGEATGIITLTGTNTKFGKTAELVRQAKTASHLQEIIFSIVRALLIADAVLVVLVVAYAFVMHIAWADILPFALIILVASVPVALPATFTLATALGAADLAKQGVLVARLTAIEEAAAMTVLACDKTGTITENRLSLHTVRAYAPFTDEDVIRYGAQASRPATQDPLDLAIIAGALQRQIVLPGKRLNFTPFDPSTKRSEALYALEDGSQLRVVKGAAQAIAALVNKNGIEADVAALAEQGNRVLAVAAAPADLPLQLVGLLGLMDTPWPDSQEMIARLNDLGVRVVMVTGDDALTAQAVAAQVGISGQACSADTLNGSAEEKIKACNIFAGVFPEDKFKLVQLFQKAGQVVGMTGDGVNDAPALKQAEVGIAVASATDVAKAAASLVLTTPGLTSIVNAVQTSRKIYQRMLTYTLNKIIRTFQIALFLSLSFVLTREFVVTPLLIILLLFANDFVTMSIATDNVSYSPKPDQWNVRQLVSAALGMSIPVLLLSFGFYAVARNMLQLPIGQLQTLMFVMLVFTNQANVFLVREREHFWKSTPSRWMLMGTIGDILVVTLLATRGILMNAIPLKFVGISLLVVIAFMFVADYIKLGIFKLTKLR